MNPKEIMHRWSAFVQTLLPSTHLYRVLGLATFSFALAQARHCHLSRVCAYVPGRVHPASVLRRLKRLLQNDKLNVEAVCDEMAAWLGRWNAPTARLVPGVAAGRNSSSQQLNNWRVVKISLCYGRRALPLVWRTDALKGRKHFDRVIEVLEHAARLTARYCPHAQVVLLADRGLCWPQIMDFAGKTGGIMCCALKATPALCPREGVTEPVTGPVTGPRCHCVLWSPSRVNGGVEKGEPLPRRDGEA